MLRVTSVTVEMLGKLCGPQQKYKWEAHQDRIVVGRIDSDILCWGWGIVGSIYWCFCCNYWGGVFLVRLVGVILWDWLLALLELLVSFLERFRGIGALGLKGPIKTYTVYI